MEFRILGPFEVIAGDRPVVLPRGRGRALLALLVLRAGDVVSKKRLIDLLWGGTHPRRCAPHFKVSSLTSENPCSRRGAALPPSLRPGRWVTFWQSTGSQVDAHRFRQMLEQSASAPAKQRAAMLQDALAMWRGSALADFTYEPFAQSEIASLEERIDADLALGRHAEALEVYRTTRRVLVEELGIEPGQVLQVLEQAYTERQRLGILDAHSRMLARRAEERLVSAGLRANAYFDVAAAENLWARAKSLLPTDHAELPRIRRRLVEAYQVLGRHLDSDAVLAEMLDDLRPGEHPGLEQVIGLERARVRLFTGPDPVRLAAIREEAERALEVLGQSGDEAGLALAYYVLGHIHMAMGEFREMELIARRELDHANRSGEPREEAAARLWVVLALVLGETPVPDCLSVCEELVVWLGMEHPLVLSELADLRAMFGDFDEARGLIARARRLLIERIRARRPLMFATGSSAAVELLAGDLAAAEREFRTALHLALELREQEWVSQFAAGLSRILSLYGSEEAEKLSLLSFEMAPAESVAAQTLWRAAKARVLANRRDYQEAEHLAWEAVQLVPRAMLNFGADRRMDLAEVLLAAGQRKGALLVIDEAIELYERKDNRVSAARAYSLRQQVAALAGRRGPE